MSEIVKKVGNSKIGEWAQAVKLFFDGLKNSAYNTRLGRIYKKGERVSLIEWVLLYAIALFLLVSFDYHDLDCILDNTMIFARSVLSGNFTEFYDINVNLEFTNHNFRSFCST